MGAYRERYENQLNNISIYGEEYRVGEWYDFLVLKTFKMPDADEYFVLKSRMYILIENYTTFPLKSIPLIEVKPVALQIQQQHKNDDKHGYKTRDYQTVLPGV